ncbi:MAG TPA: TIGR00730 family Rossman fold protein [Candidatus Binataceae bacterium]
MPIKRVCVYCASSRSCDPIYHEVAQRLGHELAHAKITVVYGGGMAGSMGHLADAALKAGGRVIGVLPQFMYDLEWGHRGLSELIVANDIHERKRLMIEEVDAVIALPGGCGTLEELFEAITWKRLGLYNGAIVMVNTRGFYKPCVELLENAVERRFMDERHRAMWTVVDEPEQVLDAIRNAPPWAEDNRRFAVQ